MKKIFAFTLLGMIFSCTPYQKLMLNPAHRNSMLHDRCDVLLIDELRHSLDTIDPDQTSVQSGLLEEITGEFDCEYYTARFYPPREDSTLWFLTIRPVVVDEDEIILGNLYTFYPGGDSTFMFQRRVKAYSQMKEFESGKYVVFNYFAESDTTFAVKIGKRKF